MWPLCKNPIVGTKPIVSVGFFDAAMLLRISEILRQTIINASNWFGSAPF
jgi:hypothetical protein